MGRVMRVPRRLYSASMLLSTLQVLPSWSVSTFAPARFVSGVRQSTSIQPGCYSFSTSLTPSGATSLWISSRASPKLVANPW
uniref:Secreted protein n=1 Tax=Arundo donax TaxID=35708 RepID=A0A0A8ZNT1_ARUDO